MTIFANFRYKKMRLQIVEIDIYIEIDIYTQHLNKQHWVWVAEHVLCNL